MLIVVFFVSYPRGPSVTTLSTDESVAIAPARHEAEFRILERRRKGQKSVYVFRLGFEDSAAVVTKPILETRNIVLGDTTMRL